MRSTRSNLIKEDPSLKKHRSLFCSPMNLIKKLTLPSSSDRDHVGNSLEMASSTEFVRMMIDHRIVPNEPVMPFTETKKIRYESPTRRLEIRIRSDLYSS